MRTSNFCANFSSRTRSCRERKREGGRESTAFPYSPPLPPFRSLSLTFHHHSPSPLPLPPAQSRRILVAPFLHVQIMTSSCFANDDEIVLESTYRTVSVLLPQSTQILAADSAAHSEFGPCELYTAKTTVNQLNAPWAGPLVSWPVAWVTLCRN